MANLSTIPGFSVGGGGGGGGGGLVTLTQIDEAVYTTDVANNQYPVGTQLNANQFAISWLGSYTAGNQIRTFCQPFRVDSTGNITVGTSSAITNSSSTSISTTDKGNPYPGRAAWVGRQHWSGSYQTLSWGFTVNNNNTCTGGVHVGSDYNSGSYGHPTSYGLIGSGSTGMFVPCYIGSNGYAGYMRYVYNGNSHYTFQTGSNYGSYSSTSSAWPALAHYSNPNATNPCGIGMDHRDPTSGFYTTEYHSNTSNSSLGYESQVYGATSYSQGVAHRLENGNAVYMNGSGGCVVTNGQGSILGQRKSSDISNRANLAYSYRYASQQALGNDYFSLPSRAQSSWIIYKCGHDGQYNPTINVVAGLFVDTGAYASVTDTRTSWWLEGNILIIANCSGSIKTYDATSLKSLMV